MRSFRQRWDRGVFLGVFVGTGLLAVGVSGCRSAQQPTIVAVDNTGPDPADANMAPVSSDGSGPINGAYAPTPGSTRLLDSNGRVLSARMSNVNQVQSSTYAQAAPQTAAPIERRTPQQSLQQDPADTNNGEGYPPQEQAGGEQVAPAQQSGDWSESEQDAYNEVTQEATAPPPELPVYDQPPAPAPNYLWTPGYWGYAPAGYYWVPGAWVGAPFYGALWTPGYWGLWHQHYGFHPGYWGRHIGFYGGVAYGSGYYGSGYYGGYWRGNSFFYNQAVNRVNVANVRNVYNRNVIVNNRVINDTVITHRNAVYNRVSYNGGRGGIQARPAAAEVAAYRGPRVAPMSAQLQNQRAAESNRQQFFDQNRGRPTLTAAPRPFAADRGVTPVNRFDASRPGQTRGVPQQSFSGQRVDARPAQQGFASHEPSQQRFSQGVSVRPQQTIGAQQQRVPQAAAAQQQPARLQSNLRERQVEQVGRQQGGRTAQLPAQTTVRAPGDGGFGSRAGRAQQGATPQQALQPTQTQQPQAQQHLQQQQRLEQQQSLDQRRPGAAVQTNAAVGTVDPRNATAQPDAGRQRFGAYDAQRQGMQPDDTRSRQDQRVQQQQRWQQQPTRVQPQPTVSQPQPALQQEHQRAQPQQQPAMQQERQRAQPPQQPVREQVQPQQHVPQQQRSFAPQPQSQPQQPRQSPPPQTRVAPQPHAQPGRAQEGGERHGGGRPH